MHSTAATRGRKQDTVWAEFTFTKDSTGRKMNLKCKTCGYESKFAKVERFREHIKKCKYQKRASEKPSNSNGSDSLHAFSASHQHEWLHQSTSKEIVQKALKQNRIDTMIQDSTMMKNKLDEQVARFIFSANLSFDTVNNPEFKKLIKMLRPSYVPPTSRIIGSSLFDNVHTKMKVAAKSQLSGKVVTIMQDGWSGVQMTPVISHCLSVDGKQTFHLNAVSASIEKKTADYCCKLLQEAIDIAKNEYGCNVGAVVTDNCSTMISLRKKIQESNKHLLTYGCNTHLLNLVGKDITSPSLMEKVKTIQHFFKDHDYPREYIRSTGGLQPVLPVETRWNSHYACISNFLTNHAKYIEIGKQSNFTVPDNVMELLMDLAFFHEVEAASKNMRPIVDAIEKVHARLSWHFTAYLKQESQESFLNIVTARRSYFGICS